MLISCFIVLLLWHSAFMQQFNFTYIDEIITLLLGLYLIYAIITRNYNPLKYENNILIDDLKEKSLQINYKHINFL